MTKRIIAIIFIFILTTIAWAILGGTILARTYDSGQVSSSRVESTWGTEHNQGTPTAMFKTYTQRPIEIIENGLKVTKYVTDETSTAFPLESSKIDVNLNLGHRQKGLLWYSTYKVDFLGHYTFRNPSMLEQSVQFEVKFPTTRAIFDNLTFTVDGNPVTLTNNNNTASGIAKIGAGKNAQLTVGYSSQGLNEWRYNFGGNDVSQVRDFSLRMKTNFKDIDFPDNTLSPSEKSETVDGWDLTWSYKNLLSGYQIAMAIFLVVSYLRLVVGIRFASREAALAQFIYLVMFSYAFFLKGFTGLAITIGSILTLFVVMQVTGRVNWAEKFAIKSDETAAELS